MKRSKLLTLLLVMALIVTTMLAGCKKKDSSDTASQVTPVPTDAAQPTVAPTDAPVADEGPADVNALPREETLYFGGQQWGAVVDFNPFSPNSNNWVINQDDDARPMVYETLFMFNQNDGQMYPLLATGYEQKDNVFTIHLNPDAHWSDGTPLTARDCVYTFEAHKRFNTTANANIWTYLESVAAPDDATFVITAKKDNFNPLKILEMLPKYYIVSEAQFTALETECNNDIEAIKTNRNDKLIASGPYKPYYDDETKVVYIRDDNYWGQAASMWGSLPVPKYLAHNIYKDNNATAVAFEAGEIDVDQQFISEVWKMWEKGLPVSTYLDDLPYHATTTLPTAVINVKKPGLDQAAVRKALAMSVDYDQIASAAMSGYTPLMSEVPPSMMNPTAGEQALIDQEALKPLQWQGKQIDEANKLLDEAGLLDTDGDGFRESNGQKIAFTVQCPEGWTDWNASLEMVAAAGQSIGLDVTTLWTTQAEWTNNYISANFDIIMYSYPGASISNPWTRCFQTMYTVPVADSEPANWNWGRYSNPEADKIIDEIPTVTDQAKLKELYTELNKIYLTDVPCFAIAYRPGMFHTVNESVWTGFPQGDDGTNIPPMVCTDGYGIASLWKLSLVK